MASTGNDRFNSEAADWDNNPSVQEATRLAFDTTLHPLLTSLSAQNPLNVLEVGCGTGLLTLRVAPLVHEIVAVDPAEGMIEMLRRKISSSSSSSSSAAAAAGDAPQNIIPICLLLSDPEDPLLPASDLMNNNNPGAPRRKFDLILSHLVMHHVPDLRAFLHTLLGCLAPGGRVALTDFEDFGPEAIKFHPPTKLEGVERHGIRRAWIEGLLREVGFEEVRVTVGWTLEKIVDEWEGTERGETLGFPFLVCEGVRP